MQCIIQQIKEGSLTCDDVHRGSIEHGLIVYVFWSREDQAMDNPSHHIEQWLNFLSSKKIMSRGSTRINQTRPQTQGGLIIVSNMTIGGRWKSGSQTDFAAAAQYDRAERAYTQMVEQTIIAYPHSPIVSAIFGSFMSVQSIARGPINYHTTR